MTADVTKRFNSFNGVGFSQSGGQLILGGAALPATELTGQTVPQHTLYLRDNGEVHKKTGATQTAGDWTLIIAADGQATSAEDADTLGGQAATNYARTDIAETFDGGISLSAGDLTLFQDPTAALHAATKQYVDSVAQGLSAKDSVRAATTANITLSGEQTIDGVTTTTDRILVKNQTATEENGIYVSGAGAWTRADDANTWDELLSAFTFVEEGTVNADTGWVFTADEGGTLDTTSLPVAQFSGAGSYTADGNGIELTGTQFSIELDGNTLGKSASGLLVNEANLTITESQISDLQSYLLDTTDTFTGTLTVTGDAAIDNININGNAITSTDVNGDITLTPNGTGSVVLDGNAMPQDLGSNGQVLTTNGAGQTSWAEAAGTEYTSDGVTTAVTLDSVLVDDSVGVRWIVAAYETGTNNVTYEEVTVIHNGITGDAASFDSSFTNQLNLGGGVTGISIDVDLNGTGASQTVRLRVAATNATNFRALRRELSI